MIPYMDLNEQADRDFGRARRRALLRRLAARLRKDIDPMPSFEDVRKPLRASNRVRLGTRIVEVDKIVGSVGRWRDFDRSFMPLRASLGERWKRIDLAYLRTEELPPVSLYKIGDSYFVADGNHRVSVARYHRTPTLEAVVTEFRPGKTAASGSSQAPAREHRWPDRLFRLRRGSSGSHRPTHEPDKVRGVNAA